MKQLQSVNNLFGKMYDLLGDNTYFSGWVTEESSNVYFFGNEHFRPNKDFVLSHFPPRHGYLIEFEGIIEPVTLFEDIGFVVLESEVKEIKLETEIPF
jgi:hypothetical protein